MKIYETLVLLDSGFAGKDDTGVNHVRSLLEKHGGEIIRIERYSEQKLAYEIKKQKRGVYVIVAFRMDPQAVNALGREFQLDEHVLRDIVLDRAGVTVDKFFRRYEMTDDARAEVSAARSY